MFQIDIVYRTILHLWFVETECLAVYIYLHACIHIHWRRQWQPTPGLLHGKSHGQRSLVGCSPWAREESDMTEQLHFQFSFPCIGEGNGNPLQYSCLENPRDRGDWWAAVYGVAQGRTWLKRLSSSIHIHVWLYLKYIQIYTVYKKCVAYQSLLCVLSAWSIRQQSLL